MSLRSTPPKMPSGNHWPIVGNIAIANERHRKHVESLDKTGKMVILHASCRIFLRQGTLQKMFTQAARTNGIQRINTLWAQSLLSTKSMDPINFLVVSVKKYVALRKNFQYPSQQIKMSTNLIKSLSLHVLSNSLDRWRNCQPLAFECASGSSEFQAP